MLKKNKLGNGTLCRAKRIKLEKGAPQLQWKNWDSVKIYTTCVRYVEWVEFERFPDTDTINR